MPVNAATHGIYEISENNSGKIEHWESIIGAQNVCRVSAKIESLKENYFELEGQKFEILA